MVVIIFSFSKRLVFHDKLTTESLPSLRHWYPSGQVESNGTPRNTLTKDSALKFAVTFLSNTKPIVCHFQVKSINVRVKSCIIVLAIHAPEGEQIRVRKKKLR